MTKIIFKEDSRDKIYKNNFGQTILLPDELNLDSSLFDDIQPIGDVRCTCFTTCDCAEDQEKREFDVEDLWQRIPKTQFGADPRDVLKEVIANGLLPKGQEQRVKDWKSFWSAKDGLRDVFDNVRSALVMSNSPVFNASYWYSEWLNVPEFGVMPEGKSTLNGHAYSIEGWKIVNNEPMLIIEAWIGRKMYMPRDVFNKAMSNYGMQSWVLSTNEIDSKRQKTILETIRDACINAIILLKQLLLVKKTEAGEEIIPVKDTYQEVKEAVKDVIKDTPKSKLDELCLAIRDYEGKPGELNYRNNNPGNCRCSSKGYKPIYGKVKCVNNFAVFESMEKGMLYLKNLIKSKISEHPNWTLIDYISNHAPKEDGNDPVRYTNVVAKRIGVTPQTKMTDII